MIQNWLCISPGLKACIDEGVCKREDVFMVSKLWCCHFEEAERACRKTLSDLGLDYLDLYLVHWPTAVAKGDDPFPKNPDGTINVGELNQDQLNLILLYFNIISIFSFPMFPSWIRGGKWRSW